MIRGTRALRTGMIGADLVRLVPSHDKSDLLRLSMCEQTNLARAAFFPLFGRALEPEQFSSPEIYYRRDQ